MIVSIIASVVIARGSMREVAVIRHLGRKELNEASQHYLNHGWRLAMALALFASPSRATYRVCIDNDAIAVTTTAVAGIARYSEADETGADGDDHGSEDAVISRRNFNDCNFPPGLISGLDSALIPEASSVSRVDRPHGTNPRARRGFCSVIVGAWVRAPRR